jgi:hypothetical protein
MARYFLTNKLDVAATVRRALDCGVLDLRILDCSGDAAGYYIDMDLTCILSEQQEKYVTCFAEKETA